jgi:hypothetical protein
MTLRTCAVFVTVLSRLLQSASVLVMRTGRLIAISGVVAFLGVPGQASAATILDTAGGTLFDPLGTHYQVNNTQAVGLEFQLASAMTITSVVAYISGSTATLGIMNNVLGKPSGTFISGDSSAITGGLVPVNLTSLNWSLAGGTYWLVAVAETEPVGMFWQNVFGNPLGNPWAHTNDGSGLTGWVEGLSADSPLAVISGTATVPSTPLPAALPLFAPVSAR